MKPEDVRAALRRLGIRPQKRLGQHFLLDERVAERHVALAAPKADETALEIGPGLGVLTRRLAARAGRVVAIEKDRRLAAGLRGLASNVEVREGDALRVPWPDFHVMAANLPYRISSPLTFALLSKDFDRAALMYQREFADRLTARPGTAGYSRITVNAFVKCACELAEVVPRSAFYPQPEVESAIVVLRPRPPPFRLEDPEMFRATVDAIFAHRRKTIGAALRAQGARFGSTGATWAARVGGAPYLERRAGELTPEEIESLARALAKG